MTKEINNKNLYQAAYGEIMLKNFLAGFCHKLGSWLVTIIVLFIIYNLAMPILNTQLKSLEKTFSGITKVLPSGFK